jgi:SAM-dependent methyltransferase
MDQPSLLDRLRVLASSRPLFIWGAGRAGIAATRLLRDRQIEPAAFIDSAAREDTPRTEGLRVHPPADLAALPDAAPVPFLVIASIHSAEIAQQAAALGFLYPADVCVWQTPADPIPSLGEPVAPNFYGLLHELRGHALADMPAGARTMLSAGCSGRWYFDWIEERYGRVDRHIGVEAYLPRPDDLPGNVEWLPRDVSHVPEVATSSVDLVFSGQNIEHLWPDQVADFLLESHRVLAPGGWLVVDSPNRDMTRPLVWTHPEHTVEYSVADIRELLDLAGFGEIAVRGIWLCQGRHGLLPLSPFDRGPADSHDVLRRAAEARARPEDSFLWWAEARKCHAPRREGLSRALARMFASAWPERLNRFLVPGPTRVDPDGRWALVAPGARGLVAEGPLFPLRTGRSRLRFHVRGQARATPCVVRLDLSRGTGDRETAIASSTVACADEARIVEVGTRLTERDEPFGFRARLWNVGDGAGEVQLSCEHLAESSC